ncbi:MAG: CCA tRNA nucleotidyltransferase [Hyphomonadaceae bacterium]|nr:CCA tRNA nucleotidyltransferase [Hyphomonadaceae bacterium]
MTSIAGAPWLAAPETRAVMAALEAARPGGARFVGGCVRNALIGQPVDDIDIATQLTPEETIAAATAAGFGVAPTGLEHGTVTVIARHKPFEVTTLRRDVATDGRRATVAFTEDWAEDASRRDFRLNALYADASGAVFDPTGGGVDDARAGRIIFIGDAETRLREDYLRILRFFRFSAWYGRGPLDERGLAACAAMQQGLDQLSAERVWKELKKLLAAPDPRPALEAMVRLGLLARIAPEAVKTDRLLRLIAIENDLLLSHEAMTRAAVMLADEAGARAFARRMKASNDERGRLAAAQGHTPRIVSYMSMREVRRALYALGVETFRDRARRVWAEEADMRKASQWRALLALADSYVRPSLPLSGDDILAAGVPPGPKVGEVRREVEAWWIDADFPDDRLSIVERLKAVAQGLS